MRLFLLPMVISTLMLASGVVAYIVGWDYVHGNIPSGWLMIATLVMPFVAFGQLLLLVTVLVVRKTQWPNLVKAGVVLGTGTIAGSLLIGLFSFTLGAVCGLVATMCWLALNYDCLTFSRKV